MATAAVIAAIGTADAAAGALISTFLSLYAAEQFLSIADHYHNLYKGQRDYYYNIFQANGEAVLADQVFNNPLAGNGQPGALAYTPQYLAQVANVESFDELFGGGAFSDDLLFPPSSLYPNGWWSTHAHMYNDVPYTSANDPRGFPTTVAEPVQLDKAATLADFENYFYRYEEHRKDVYDERTWEWQNQSLNFGVKQASVVESGLATSFKFIDESMGNAADFFGVQANGLFAQKSYRKQFDEDTKALAAASQRGRALAISTNLGNDIGVNDTIYSSGFQSGGQSPRRARVE